VDGHSYLVATAQTLGLAWGPATDPQNQFTEFDYTITRAGETPWKAELDAPACVLRADSHVAAVELKQTVPGLSVMELAGTDAILQADMRKLNIFKSNAAGLSFEVEASPDLADSQYVVVKRTLRGPATWFENPAYRADTGDYMVTTDGKLIGIMVSRERCFILNKDNIRDCALTAPLANVHQFQAAAQQYLRGK
jgi:hypothetical protein